MDGNPLVDAAYEGNTRRVKELLDAGCYGNEEHDAEQCSLCDALETASANGHYEIVELLLRYGADVNYSRALVDATSIS